MIAKGSFETSISQAPPYESVDGVAFARSRWQRTFTGDLTGESQLEMLGARTPRPGSGGYVALERVSCVLHGRRGTFAILHMAVMGRARRSVSLQIVPDSGTGELRNIAGTMEVNVQDGVRLYCLDYSLDPG